MSCVCSADARNDFERRKQPAEELKASSQPAH